MVQELQSIVGGAGAQAMLLSYDRSTPGQEKIAHHNIKVAHLENRRQKQTRAPKQAK